MYTTRSLIPLSPLAALLAICLSAPAARAADSAPLPDADPDSTNRLAMAQSPDTAEVPDGSTVQKGRTQFALRGGGAGPYAGGILGGFDITVPSAAIGPGWTGRFDLDNWGISFMGSSSSGTSITFSQVSSGIFQPVDLYYGLGAGFTSLRDDDESDVGPEAKLILGLNLGGHMALEGNLHFGAGVTNSAGMLRLRF